MTDNLPCTKEGTRNKNVISRLFSFLSKNTLLLVIIVVVLTIVISSVISIVLINSRSEVYLPSLVAIKTVNVEVYWDANCQNKTDLIRWNDLEVGETVNMTVYVKSVSNVMLTLSTASTDWDPEEIEEYLTFSTNSSGQKFSPQEVIPVKLMLSTSSSDEFVYYLVDNEIQTFSFVIHFIGSG